MNLRLLVTTVGLAVAAACGGGSSSSSSPSSSAPAGQQITINDYAFSPSTLTIKAGTSVSWNNMGPSPHTVVSDTGVWTSPTMAAPGSGGGGYGGGGGGSEGGAFQYTFSTPGTFSYHCSLHPPSMHPGFTGTITVTQ